jgi:hypothetical protein
MPGLGLRLDRKTDPRNANFPMLAAPSTILPNAARWLGMRSSFDQGNTGTCGGHAAKAFLLTSPVVQTKPDEAPTRWDLYRAAVAIDEWTANDGESSLPDGDPRLEFGTSTLAIMKALQSFGFVDRYEWASDVDTISRFIRSQKTRHGDVLPEDVRGGPVIFGTNWYSSMSSPDAEGYLRITPNARLVGGHLYLLDYANANAGYFEVRNSWGTGWGGWMTGRVRVGRGKAKLDFETAARLLAENGDAVTARERRVP